MALFPIPTLATHDARFSDSVPVVGGPYMAGHTPDSTNIMSVPSANTVPGSRTIFDGVSLATIRGERSSGDNTQVPNKYITEDHACIPQPA